MAEKSLYTRWAIEHLAAIDHCIKFLGSFSNTNLMDSISVLHDERERLIKGDENYANANETLIAVRKIESVTTFPYGETLEN